MTTEILNPTRSFAYKEAVIQITHPKLATHIYEEVTSILSGEVIPLKNELLIRWALKLTSEVRNTNVAVVMYKSQNMEDDDWVGSEEADVTEYEKSGKNFFSPDIEAQLWVTL